MISIIHRSSFFPPEADDNTVLNMINTHLVVLMSFKVQNLGFLTDIKICYMSTWFSDISRLDKDSIGKLYDFSRDSIVMIV